MFEQCLLLVLGFAIIMVAASFVPNRASAFWPFFVNADAATAATIPGSSTPALRASVNIDPNPNKGLGDVLQTSGGRALLASAGPAGTIADVAGSTPSDSISIYVVRKGDTLGEIANMFGVSANTILWANDLKSARDVHPGDTLAILPISGVEHTVVKGDTLKSLAKKYGADVDEITLFNELDSSESLKLGSVLIIPGGELLSQTPSKKPSSSRSYSNPLRNTGGAAFPGYFSNPVPGGTITQGPHGGNAVDIAAPRGTPIYAAADGIIIIARTNGAWNGGYGSYIVITHDNGSQTLYSHLKSATVGFGEAVNKGQLIGYVGTTGRVTGPHLHFEVRGAANPFRNCSVGRTCAPQ